MKKNLAVLISVLLLLGMVLPIGVLAQIGAPTTPGSCVIRADTTRVQVTGCGAVGVTCDYSSDTGTDCGICCLIGTVLYVTDWIFVALLIMVMVYILMGAYDILTSAGEPTKMNSGRNKIMYAALGFGIALLARAIPSIVRFLVVGAIQ